MHFVLALMMSAAGAAANLPLFTASDLTPYWDGEQKVAATPAQITSFRAVDQHGHQVNEKNFDQKISLVNFFFVECPGTCPPMMAAIQDFKTKTRKTLGDVPVYSFSVQPQKDTPEHLQHFAHMRNLNLQSWVLLTGDRQQIYHVGKDMFKADGAVGRQKSEDGFVHSQNIYLIDGQRRIRGIYDTRNAEMMKLLAQDISALQKN